MGNKKSCKKAEEKRRQEEEQRRQEEERRRQEEERRRRQEEENRRRKEEQRRQQEEARRRQIQKENRAREQFKLGMTLWDTAWELERSDKAEEAKDKFKKAQELFRLATNAVPSNTQYSRYNNLTQYKIDGNAAFNDGLRLHADANMLMKSGKYVEASQKYALAMELFRKGSKTSLITEAERFIEVINIVSESIDAVRDAVRTLNSFQQNKVLQELRRIVNEKKRKQVVNENTNIDIVFQYLKDSNV